MLKIAIVGPESTGKSELSIALATHFSGNFVPEFARKYVEQLDRNYLYEDVVFIAQKQIEEQDYYLNNNNNNNNNILNPLSVVFFDTELIITKVWLEFCYKSVPEFINERISNSYFDLYLLCYPDLPWVFDPVREHGGDERLFFFDWYKREIEKLGIPYVVIDGIGTIRTENAIAAVNKIIKL